MKFLLFARVESEFLEFRYIAEMNLGTGMRVYLCRYAYARDIYVYMGIRKCV